MIKINLLKCSVYTETHPENFIFILFKQLLESTIYGKVHHDIRT